MGISSFPIVGTASIADLSQHRGTGARSCLMIAPLQKGELLL